MSPAPLARWLLVALGVLVAAPAGAQTASAPAPPSDQAPLLPLRVETHAAFTWDGSFGVGARAEISLLGKARLYENSHDELALSLGADVAFVTFDGSDRLAIWPTAVVQWSLGVSERGALFPELGLTARVRPDGWDGIFPNIGFGGRYYLHRSIALLGRLGWPMAVSLGMTF